MKNSQKIRVLVLYGGRSGEHEVSLRSAASVLNHLDRDRFEVLPVAIDKQGHWLMNDVSLIEKSAVSLPVFAASQSVPEVVLLPNPSSASEGLVGVGTTGTQPLSKSAKVDVVFPVMHGTFCEDGTVQGLLEMADVPYVGCGVLASAVGMDKDVAKRLVRDAGLPIVPFLAIKHEVWKKKSTELTVRVAEFGYPVFVKPANSGSSVGVHKVKQPSALKEAIEDAFRIDSKILIEKAVDAREIELAVLENSDAGSLPLVSVPGEVSPTHEFYSYDAKYTDEGGAKLMIPAQLTASQLEMAQKIAREAFDVLECEGMARVDLFLDRKTGEFYFNEVNTLPGFTSISMYPKMWERSGIPYSELLSRLIDLALVRHQKKSKLIREYKS